MSVCTCSLVHSACVLTVRMVGVIAAALQGCICSAQADAFLGRLVIQTLGPVSVAASVLMFAKM